MRIIEAEEEGFAPLRGPSSGDVRWRGRVVPAGFGRCDVEGDYYPGAIYVCRGRPSPDGTAEILEPSFVAIEHDLDACLSRAMWYPRNWHKGRPFDFAGGERQLMWRDVATTPKPGVILKIEEDYRSGAWLLRLAVRTLR